MLQAEDFLLQMGSFKEDTNSSGSYIYVASQCFPRTCSAIP